MTSIVEAILGRDGLSIFNMATGQRVLEDLKVKGVRIVLPSQVMGHKEETGNTIIDTRVNQQIRIYIDGIAPNANDVDQINEAMLNRSNLYSITTRGLIYDYMMLCSEDFDHGRNNTSSHPSRLIFDQLLLEGYSQITYANQADSSLASRGLALVRNAQEEVADLYAKVQKIFN